MLNKLKLFGDISKSEKKPDGTLIVCGYASSGAIDSDGEVITPEAMKAAIPNYMEFGCVREMHGSSAAGTALNIRVEDDGRTYFEALIVDSEAIKKCELGVYKGFSIGAIVKARDALNKMVIKAIELFEISLVDRPANPAAVFSMFKGINMTEQVEDAQVTEPVVETPATAEELAVKQATAQGDVIVKSLDNVRWTSEILENLTWLEDQVKKEEFWTQSSHEVSEDLKAIIKTLAEVFNKQVAVETAALTKNDKTVSLEEDKELVSKFLSFVKSQKESEDKESIEKFNKISKENEELVEKATKLQSEKEALENRVKELEALPMPPKVAKSTLPVTKESDNNEQAQDDTQFNVYKADGTLDVLQTSIKKSTYLRYGSLLKMG